MKINARFIRANPVYKQGGMIKEMRDKITFLGRNEGKTLRRLDIIKSKIGLFDYTQDIDKFRSFTIFFCVMPHNLRSLFSLDLKLSLTS